MSLPNENPDGSKKRKRDEDGDKKDDAGLTKRQRDGNNARDESDNVTPPSSSVVADPTPGCSYNWWRAQSAAVQEKVEPENTEMDWRQEKETEVEEEFRPDSGLSGFTAETEVDDDDEEECETTCRLVSRPSYECEDESWDDEEDLVLRFSSIIYVGEPPREPKYGPEEIPKTLYNPETAMEEGWDWPDPDEAKAAQEDADDARDVLALGNWDVPCEIQDERLVNEGERLMNEGVMEGEKVMNPNNDANQD